MRFLQLLSLATGVASTAINPLARLNLKHPSTLLPAASLEPVNSSGKPLQPFGISDLYSESFVDSSSTYNRSLSCTSNPTTHSIKSLTRSLSVVFSDPNSNTSTICSKSWIDAHNSSTAPFTYVLCDDTGKDEDFQWQFTSYTSIQHFSVEFSHGWDDPTYVFSPGPSSRSPLHLLTSC